MKKKFVDKIKDNVVATLIGMLLTGGVAFTLFAFNVYNTVTDTVPKLKNKIITIEDSIKKSRQKPLEIETNVKLLQQDVQNVKKNINEIKKAQNQQLLTNEKIYQLLIEIKKSN